MTKKHNNLGRIVHRASEEMYAAGQGAQGADAGAQNAGNAGGAENVQDADFEEVK